MDSLKSLIGCCCKQSDPLGSLFLFFLLMRASHSFGSPFVCDLAKEKTYLLKVMQDPIVVIFKCLLFALKHLCNFSYVNCRCSVTDHNYSSRTEECVMVS